MKHFNIVSVDEKDHEYPQEMNRDHSDCSKTDSSKESLADRYSADFDISYHAKKFISGGSNLNKKKDLSYLVNWINNMQLIH